MEHTLGVVSLIRRQVSLSCLNPCFNGTYSRSMAKIFDYYVDRSLNPCFNGTYSRSNEQTADSTMFITS